MSEDPINLKVHEFSLQKDENIIMEAFETAASSFKVSAKLSTEYYYPKQTESIESDKNTKKLHSEEPVMLHKQPDSKFSRSIQKNAEPNKKISPPLQNIKSTVPSSVMDNDERPTYPPPLPLDSDPVRNKMLHAWYWAGYYTGYADAKSKIDN